MNPETDSPHPPARSWKRRYAAFLLLAIRHSTTWALRLFFAAVILLMVTFAYLHIVGVPAVLADLFLDRLAGQGLFLQLERLHVEMDRGLVARHIRLYASPDAPTPLLTAREFCVALNPQALWRQRRSVPVFSIHNGTLHTELGANQTGARQGSRSILVENISFRLMASDQEVILREFTGDWLGIRFRGRGAVYPSAVRRPHTPSANPLPDLLHALDHAPEWAAQAVERINAIVFHAPPSVDFTFALYPDHPEAHTAAIRMEHSAGGEASGIAFDQLSVDLEWREHMLHVRDLHLRKDDGVLSVSGWMNASNQTTALHVLHTLPAPMLIEALPDDLRRTIAEAVPDPNVPLRLDLNVGPAPLPTAIEHLSGRMTVSGLRILDVPVDLLDVHFTRDGNDIRVAPSRLHLDTGPNASRLAIQEGFFQLDTLRFEARVDGSFNPHLLRPVMTPNMQNVVDWFGIEEPLRGQVLIGGTVGDRAIYCYGPVQATNVTISGVPIQSANGLLNITNEVMHLTGATVIRPEGMARGEAHMAFSNQTLRLRADSTLDPRATAQMLGPVVAEFMAPFRLNGPARVQVQGLLDYCNFSLNQLTAHVEAQRFGYDLWEADTVDFDLEVTGRRIRVPRAAGSAYGGAFTGNGVFYPVGNDHDWRYEVDLTASGARLQDLLEASFERPMGELRGTLNGTASVGGYFGIGTGPAATGTGRVEIRNGLLFETRLLSGLSAILSKLIPDFNLFAQTDATATYAIRNSRVYSPDIFLKGTLFSAKGSGHCTFDGQLNYRVEIQALRGGPVAALVRLATLPVTRLLELRLTGPLDDPRWRPVNFKLPDLFE